MDPNLITLGELLTWLGVVVAIITSVSTISKTIEKFTDKLEKRITTPFMESLDHNSRTTQANLEATKELTHNLNVLKESYTRISYLAEESEKDREEIHRSLENHDKRIGKLEIGHTRHEEALKFYHGKNYREEV